VLATSSSSLVERLVERVGPRRGWGRRRKPSCTSPRRTKLATLSSSSTRRTRTRSPCGPR